MLGRSLVGNLGVGEMAALEAVRLGEPSSERPAPGRRLVRRRRLFERLSGVDGAGVVLVCAPAGSGKSLLARSWLEAEGLDNRVAWVAVARNERDAQRFWTSMVEALAGIVASPELTQPSQGSYDEATVEPLLRALEGLDRRAVLVVDDLHELRSGEALAWLELLLAGLPRQLVVVLATREDPRLGLHGLRLTGNLTELRGPDLAFSVEETRELLVGEGIRLSEAGVALLHERTEGWAAGLRLATISLSRHPDPERFVSEFSGSERTVAGYLLAEVLERQPAEVRELLLRTSILDRVCGPLADFLTGNTGSERILQELEDAGAFVSSLDVGRSWFRYHRLFADLLQLELRRVSPTMVAALHRAAAQWHEGEGDIVEAIRHALAAREWPLAVRLLAAHHHDLTLDGRTATVCELLSAFPEDVIAADPELALVFATARLSAGRVEDGEAFMRLAERRSDLVPETHRGSFQLQLAQVRLVLARQRGDLAAILDTMPLFEAALAVESVHGRRLTEDNQSVALQNLGIAELWASRFDDSRRHLEQALAIERRSGRPWLEVTCLGHLALVGPITGLPLTAGLRLSQEAVTIAEAHGWGERSIIVPALGAGATALLLLGRLNETEQWLERAEHLVQPDSEPGAAMVVCHARGTLRLAQGRLDEALGALCEAERMQGRLVSEPATAVAVRARLLQTQARMGEPELARAALAEMDEAQRDTAHMRLADAGIALAESAPEQALDRLAPVIQGTAPMIHRTAAMAEAHALEARARDQLGDRRGAEASVERALELAEPDGIIVPFILAQVEGLLERHPRHRTAHATLVRTILDVLAGASARPRGQTAPLLDGLSEAELRVVRYLPSNLRAPEIAAELCVSANTVRTHIRHIYSKLTAHDRSEAVTRARELGLLARSR